MIGVVSFDCESSSFPFTNWVKQGWILISTLFGIFFSMWIYYAFNDSTDGMYLHTISDASLFNLARLKDKTLVQNILVRELLFADDAVLVSYTEEGLQCMFSKFVDDCNEFGVIISIKRTQVMGLNTSSVPSLHLEGHSLEAVIDLVYPCQTYQQEITLTQISREGYDKLPIQCSIWVR